MSAVFLLLVRYSARLLTTRVVPSEYLAITCSGRFLSLPANTTLSGTSEIPVTVRHGRRIVGRACLDPAQQRLVVFAVRLEAPAAGVRHHARRLHQQQALRRAPPGPRAGPQSAASAGNNRPPDRTRTAKDGIRPSPPPRRGIRPNCIPRGRTPASHPAGN